MRGRRPDPAAVKEQKAPIRSQRKPRSASASGQSIAAADAPPRWLKDEGLKVWHRLAPTLRAAKLLTHADTETFARYCRNFARWLKMQSILDAEGETYESESQHGRLRRANPAFLIADRLERQLLAAEDRFGLNPAERQRMMVQRAATGATGDLFDPAGKKPRATDPAAQPTAAARPIDSPVGFLQ